MSGDTRIIEQVTDFARRAHGEQKRKYTPEPYIVHPIRVQELCAQYTDDPCILSAALLHDVLEDTPVTKGQILEFLQTLMDRHAAVRTLGLVVELTDVYIKSAYPQYNRRRRKDMERDRISKTSPDSQTIKYADIIDNCREITTHDPDFARVFLRECDALLRRIPHGNPELYEIARGLVGSRLAAAGTSRRKED